MLRTNGVMSARIYRPPSRESHNLFENDPKDPKTSKQLLKANASNLEAAHLKRVQLLDPKMALQIPMADYSKDGTMTDDGGHSPTLSQGTIDGSSSPKRRLKLENQHKHQKEMESKMRTIEKYGRIVNRREEIKKDPDFQTNLFNYAQKKILEKASFGQMQPQVKAQILEVDDLLEGIFDIDEANLKRPRKLKKREAPPIDPNFGKDYVKAMTSKSVQLICELRRSKESHDKIINNVLLSNTEQEKSQREKINKNIELMKQSISIIQKMEEERKKQRMKERKGNLKTDESDE
ncbi:hypothetical protein NAEGRDRAFT_80402 [Naegleria gruberi]|uniref:Uncharacterized protein n=1 Tax=Naegleria gruberi TaxID=5762 RepID=D2VL31_NAEGR|nr:uncharacterized protein NAEGRDRAFT_80402 [Naegleria gruberi]EFC42551.1 hypothetical protein NAEGRDRAFT_80402 [Naegleria gruberi]|eukprot:XP_002675295.1 hypothetical protein NAEGRDRAFT_80402 [Naegleria gruberi strain NEG-M]